MVLKKRLDNYFMGKEGKVLKLSNGYSVKLTVVNHHYNSLDLRFYYDEETTDINFNYYDSFIIASSDCDSKQVKVIDMHHVGYIIDTTLCDWVENRDDIGLEWSNYMEKENDYED